MEKEKLKSRLTPCVPLRFPGFEKQYQYEQEKGVGETLAYNFEPVDCRDWYRDFAERVISAVDRGTYLPVYRMGDGEYLFAMQGNPEGDDPFWQLPLYGKVKRIVRKIKGNAQRGGWSGETYTVEERQRMHDKFLSGLRKVSENGILALCLHKSNLYNRYLPDILNWMDENNIALNKSNYIHFYAVYALFNGIESERLLGGRKVLVITGLDPERKNNIERGLKNKNVGGVEFLPVSKRKSMLDNINESKIGDDIDLVLIAAGIGSINIINQIDMIDTPQLDVGYCIDILEDPNVRWKRPYCTPDDKFDPHKVEFV